MTVLAMAYIDGIPGPKGSLNAFCPVCAKRGLSQRVIVKEQSEIGVKFRKVVARELKLVMKQFPVPIFPYSGAVETRLIFFIPRQMAVKNGIAQDYPILSHDTLRPTHRGSGDIEKHVRVVHDAMMDAGLIVDDSQVWRCVAEKQWSSEGTPAGLGIEVLTS